MNTPNFDKLNAQATPGPLTIEQVEKGIRLFKANASVALVLGSNQGTNARLLCVARNHVEGLVRLMQRIAEDTNRLGSPSIATWDDCRQALASLEADCAKE